MNKINIDKKTASKSKKNSVGVNVFYLFIYFLSKIDCKAM